MGNSIKTSTYIEPFEKRTKSIKVRLTPSEHEEILLRCKAYGYKSLTRYVTAMCTGQDDDRKAIHTDSKGGEQDAWERQVGAVIGNINNTIENYNKLYSSAVAISDGIMDANARGRFALRISKLYKVTNKLVEEYRALRMLLESLAKKNKDKIKM